MTTQDDPVVAALTGPHAGFAERVGRAVRYAVDVAPFGGIIGEPDDTGWTDLATLVGPGGAVAVMDASTAPSAWDTTRLIPGLRMAARGLLVAPDDPRIVVLGPDDLADVLALVKVTDPGPFRDRTMELGTYLGIRIDGHLAAMAGERMHPPGRTEISAVCTDPMFRGRGLAGTLVRDVGSRIVARGEQPFLHVMAKNVGAVRLYESLGFEVVAEVPITVVVAPDGS